MIAEDYLRMVAFELRDLPWRMRRDLVSELRAHLDELPAGTNLQKRLGKPHEYAAEMRAAAGLERRRGLLAFVRARRPRNLILLAVALTVFGLAIGADEWIDSYQPLALGNGYSYPKGAEGAPAGDSTSVVFRPRRPFRLEITVQNTGRFTVRIEGIPLPPGLPVSVRALMSRSILFTYGGMPPPYRRFHSFDLKPGYERVLVLTGVYACKVPTAGGGAEILDSIPVRFSFLWRSATVDIPLPKRLAIVFPKKTGCS